ncbi:hypothetical protein D3C80_1310300 [compost metagenome]
MGTNIMILRLTGLVTNLRLDRDVSITPFEDAFVRRISVVFCSDNGFEQAKKSDRTVVDNAIL